MRYRKLCSIILWIAAACLLALSVYAHAISGEYGDKQWEMLYGRMWFGGAALYHDILPVAPPLIFWLYGIAAFFASFLDLSAAQGLTVVTLLLVALSIALSTHLLRMHPGFETAQSRMGFAAFLAFVLIFRASPIYFADREHLFFTLMLPYALRFMPALAGQKIPRPLSLCLGALAALGLCMKPQCLVVLLGIALLQIPARRVWGMLWSVENITIYVLGGVYVIAVGLLYPHYYGAVMPMAMATYWFCRDETPVWSYAANGVSVLFSTLVLFNPLSHSPYRSALYYWLGLCPFYLLYALLNNNWAYTYFPLSSAALMVTGFALWEFVWLAGRAREDGKKRWRPIAGAVLCALTLGFKGILALNFFAVMLADNCQHNPACRGDDRFMAEVQGPDGVQDFGALTIDFTRYTRLADYSGARWVTRFAQLWMIPAFLHEDAAFGAQHRWIIDYVGNAYADDLNRNKPAVMFVDDTNAWFSVVKDIDLVALFSTVPAFKKAWEPYRFVHKIDMCGTPTQSLRFKCRYDVYRREEP